MKPIRSAFTLIELLVVIAIIAILAAILFPVFAQAKAAAKKTQALSNTKQLVIGMEMYMRDNDGVYPGYVQRSTTFEPPPDTPIWTQMIQPYVKNQGIMLDPAAKNTKYSGIWQERGHLSIGYNLTAGRWLVNNRPARPKENEFFKPSSTVLFASTPAGPVRLPEDSSRGYRGYITWNWDDMNGVGCGRPAVINGDNQTATLADRHQGGANLGLADGHAKWYKIARIVPDGRRPARQDECLFCIVNLNPSDLRWMLIYTCSETDF